jgi:tRNA(adenine34) deaminase
LIPLSDQRALDEQWMREALIEARVAEARGEVPVGAVLIDATGALITRAHNLRETLEDPTAHAELLALRWAAMDRRSWRLSDLTLYVTLEPCPMCAGALVNARVPRVVWGCDDPKAGAVTSLFNIGTDPRLNHRFEITRGVLADECSDQLKRFFKKLREKKNKP